MVIGATIAGFRNKESFVDGFNNYINEELAPAFAISLTLAMVSFGVSKAVQAIQNAIPKTYKFKSKFELKKHFLKHNEDFNFMFKNTKEYLDAANYVIKNGTYVPEMNGYLRFFGIDGKANYAFVGMTHDGKFITTFGLRHIKKLEKVSWIKL